MKAQKYIYIATNYTNFPNFFNWRHLVILAMSVAKRSIYA